MLPFTASRKIEKNNYSGPELQGCTNFAPKVIYLPQARTNL